MNALISITIAPGRERFMELNITPNREGSQGQYFQSWSEKKLFSLTVENKFSAIVTALTYARYGETQLKISRLHADSFTQGPHAFVQ
jgi:hypothetical protein